MIRVLVVDDSAYSRKVITRILASIPDVQVIETATDGQDALKKTVRFKPDLITLDLQMPLMDGFTFLRWVKTSMPTPVIVVSSQEADENVFKAIDLGALDFVVKPTPHPSMRLEEIESDLIEKVLAIPLLKHRKTRERMVEESQKTRQLLEKAAPLKKPEIIGIAASTGGPPAIQSILRQLPSHFDVPIVIAQHMPAGFTALFAERLNRSSSLQVQEGANGTELQAGNVYVAPGGKHLLVERKKEKAYLKIQQRYADVKYNPSADALFRSMSEQCKSCTIGAVLTGMGDDGKSGLIEMKRQGGITIAESERTAVIFGMPQEAIQSGAVDYVLPLGEIPVAFMTLCKIRVGAHSENS